MKHLYLLLILLLANCLSLQANRILVSTGGNIQTVINSAINGDTILVQQGIYTENLFIINKNISLFSFSGAEHTLINGIGGGSVLKIISSIVHIKGFTLYNGTGDTTLLDVPNVGLHVDSVGGGIFARNIGNSLLEDLIIENNHAHLGAGIYIRHSKETLKNTLIRNNTATLFGGGIWAVGNDTSYLVNTLIYLNHAGQEAGAIGGDNNTQINLTNTVIAYNTTNTMKGEALWRANSSSFKLSNSIIWGHHSHLVYSFDATIGSINVLNSAIAHDSLGGITTGFTATFTDTLLRYPAFYNVLAHDFHLSANSPCRDAGINSNIPSQDFEGRNRVLGIAPDIGAYEFDTTLTDTTLAAILPNSAYPFQYDGQGGAFYTDRIIVTYQTCADSAHKAAFRAIWATVIDTVLPLPCHQHIEEWYLNAPVADSMIASGNTPNSSPPPTKRLERDPYIAGGGDSTIIVPNISPIFPSFPPPAYNPIQDTLVGLLDTGVDFSHPSLQNVLYYSPNSTYLEMPDDLGLNIIDGNANIWDDNIPSAAISYGGHGTHVAGIIKQAANLNGISHIKLLSIKVLDKNGIGSVFDVGRGICYGITKNVKALNLSLGNYGAYSPFFNQLITDAADANVLIVTAAGNDGVDTDEKRYQHYPSGFANANIISVAADSSNHLASWSNRGISNETCVRSVDIAAEGDSILSILPTYHPIYSPNQLFPKSGTSMAAPFVMGCLIREMQIGTPISMIKDNLIKLSSWNPLADSGSISKGALSTQMQTNWYLSDTAHINATYIALADIYTSNYTIPQGTTINLYAGGAIHGPINNDGSVNTFPNSVFPYITCPDIPNIPFISKYDTTVLAPTITAPSPLIIHADSSACYASYVNLGQPIANNFCDSASITNNAPLNFPLGNTLVTWKVSNCCGVEDSATQLVTVIPTLNVTIPTSYSTCYSTFPTTIAATITGGASPFTYSWVNVTNNITLGTSNAIAVSRTATKTYRVYISDACNTKDTATMTLTINPLPLAIINPTGPTTFCANTPTVLFANTGAGYTYQWKRSNIILPNTTPYYTPTVSGNHAVTVTNANGCSNTSAWVNITVKALPIAIAGIDKTTCIGASVQIGSSNIAGNTYTWTPNTNLSNSYISNPLASPNTTTTYTVTVHNTNTNCSKTDAVLITTTTPPATPSLTSTASPVCQGLSINLTPTSTGLSSINWYKNGVFLQTRPANLIYPVTIPSANGDLYSIKAKGEANCLSAFSNTINAWVKDAPIPTITSTPAAIGNLITVCVPNGTSGSATLTANSTSSPSYSWKLAGNYIPGANTNTYVQNVTLNSNFRQVSVEATYGNACLRNSETKIIRLLTAGCTPRLADPTINLYPNPTTDKITLTTEGDKLQHAKIFILDELGKKVYEFECEQDTREISIDLRDFASSIYILQVIGREGEMAVFKVVKE